MDAAELTAVEEALRHRAAALELRITGMTTPPERGTGISFGKRVGDGTTEAVRRLTEVGVGSALESSQARALRALEKLDEGTYGTCDTRGRPIVPARLRVAPESVLCIEGEPRRLSAPSTVTSAAGPRRVDASARGPGRPHGNW